MLFDNICSMERLPHDIKYLIMEFIPKKAMGMLNKYYYNKYHRGVVSSIVKQDQYLRDMIERDNEFVLEHLIRENIQKWIQNKKCIYKNMVFNNYIYFLIHLCFENDAEKCINIITQYLKKHDLCRNLHKKKTFKYIKWTKSI